VLVIACITYLIVVVYNSTNGWQLLELKEDKLPFVSIIVPTLNEENNIGNCLDTITALDYSNKEIIVVDGGSKDKTVEIAEKYPVRVIVEPNLPDGWVGKSYGCHVGYLAANGEVLLFTDADTKHEPYSLNVAISHFKGTNSTLFSIYPYQICERWYEYLISYFYFLSYLAAGPRKDINNPYDKNSFIASGQYMMFSREGYQKIGGHLAISGSLVEDVALAKLVKEKEEILNFVDGTKIITTRMYPDKFGDFFRAFRRAVYGGMVTLPWWRVVFVALWIVYFLLAPYFFIDAFINQENWFVWDYTIGILINGLAYFAYSVAIWLYWRKRGMGFWLYYIIYPIPMIINIVIIVISILNGIRGKTVSWRGRYYTHRGETDEDADLTAKSVEEKKPMKVKKPVKQES
jgi:glycosyltransferase involved in cell wall biosynthesis